MKQNKQLDNLQVLIGKEKLKNRQEILAYLKRSIIEKPHTKEIKESMFDHAIRLAKEDKAAEFADWLEVLLKKLMDEYHMSKGIEEKIKELRSNPFASKSVDGNGSGGKGK